MQRSGKNNANSRKTYDLSNYFGFGDNDIDLSLWEKSSVISETVAPPEFQADKPYRLALYVRPSERKRLLKSRVLQVVKNVQNVNATTEKQRRSKRNEKQILCRDANTTTEKQPRSKKNEVTNISKAGQKRPTRTTTRTNTKENFILFDENVKPESFPKETKQNKTRRSYERKFKEKEESENIPEPPSEEIMKELEFKKLSRTKKKATKEEQEFEKWASSVNSDFNDVDKFELSIAYD